MQVTQYQTMYEKILEKIGRVSLKIYRTDAYSMAIANDIYYPFKEVDSYIYSADSAKNNNLKEKNEAKDRAFASFDEYKKDKSDKTEDFRLFQFKYCDASMDYFQIPIAEVIKNYFLSFQNNIDNFRRGTKDLESISHMQIYEHILKTVRETVVDILLDTIKNDSVKMSEKDLKNFFGDEALDSKTIDNASKQAQEAKEILDVLKMNESKASDYKNTVNDASYSGTEGWIDYSNFSKQIFIDLIAKSYNDKPIVKKAVSTYIDAQSDKNAVALMKELFDEYASHKLVRSQNKKEFFDGVNFMPSTFDELVK